MRSATSVFVTGFLALLSAPAAFASDTVDVACESEELALDPVALYGAKELDFTITRKGNEIGQHTVTFEPQGAVLSVRVHTRINVSILMVPVYSYDYQSQEVWCGLDLASIETVVIENGERKETKAQKPGYATNHWNMAALENDQLFNTITGRMNAIEVVSSEDDMKPESSRIPLTTYRYDVSGELTYSAWYDDLGRWLRLQFLDKRGVPITLTCTNCLPQPTDEESAA